MNSFGILGIRFSDYFIRSLVQYVMTILGIGIDCLVYINPSNTHIGVTYTSLGIRSNSIWIFLGFIYTRQSIPSF